MCDVRPLDVCDARVVGRVTQLWLFGLRADTPRVPAVVPALDGTERGLDPRLRTAWTLAAAAASVAAGSAGAVITLIADGPAWLVALFAVAGLVLAAVAAALRSTSVARPSRRSTGPRRTSICWMRRCGSTDSVCTITPCVISTASSVTR